MAEVLILTGLLPPLARIVPLQSLFMKHTLANVVATLVFNLRLSQHVRFDGFVRHFDSAFQYATSKLEEGMAGGVGVIVEKLQV
jgi:hypothetical protein